MTAMSLGYPRLRKLPTQMRKKHSVDPDAMQLSSFVALGKLLTLPGPRFPHL